MLLKTIAIQVWPQDLTHAQLQMATEAQLLVLVNHFYALLCEGNKVYYLAKNLQMELHRRNKKIVAFASMTKDGRFIEKFYIVNKE